LSEWRNKLGRVGIWSAEMHFGDQSAAADAAAEIEELGFGALWFPGAFGGPVFDMGANLLGATNSIPVAIGILNMWKHSAQEVAAGRERLEEKFPGRFLLGLGVSHPEFVNSSEEVLYDKPFSALVRYLDELSEADPPIPNDAIVLAALKSRIRALSLERAAGAHTYFVPAEHTAITRESFGPEPLLAPEHAVVLETDPARAREIARKYMATYLGLPNYQTTLRDLGFSEEDVTGAGSDRLIDELVAWGDGATIRRKIGKHYDAGADHVCVHVLHESWGPPFVAPMREYRELAEVLL